MFKAPVNTLCNNILFSGLTMLTMPSDSQSQLHPSVEALYRAAMSHDDRQPADVARRMNVSPQVLQNWESRGISKQGALQAQRTYDVDATALMRGDLVHLGAKSKSQVADSKASHLQRFDASILAATHRALRELYWTEFRLPYNLEDDPEHFLQAYELSSKLSAQVTGADLVQIFKAAGLGTDQGIVRDGQSGDGRAGMPDEGVDQGKVARKVQRKKA